jgi:hypothetical protein
MLQTLLANTLPFLQLQHHHNKFGAAWQEFCLYSVHI